jgi:hypothetical protein
MQFMAGGVKKTIGKDKKGGKAGKQTHKETLTKHVSNVVDMLAALETKTSVIAKIRQKVIESLESSDNNLFKMKLDNLKSKELVSILGEMRKASNSDFKMQLLTKALYKT